MDAVPHLVHPLPMRRFLLVGLSITCAMLGCTLDRAGLSVIESHCDVDLDRASVCAGGIHSYVLSGICFTPQLAFYQVTAQARFDAATGKASEWIEAVGILGGEGTASSVSNCSGDPFVHPGRECTGGAFQTDVPQPLHTSVYPLLKAVVTPADLAAIDAGCTEPGPPPPAAPAPKPRPKLKLPPLVIVSPAKDQTFRPGTSSFQLELLALGTPPATVEIEWQALKGRQLETHVGPPTQIGWRGLPLTLEVKPASETSPTTYRVRVRPLGERQWSSTRTFQLHGTF